MDMRQSNQSPQRRATKFIPSPCPQTSFHPPCRGPCYQPGAGNLLLDVRNFGAGIATALDAVNVAGDSVSRVSAASFDGVNDTEGRPDTLGLVTRFTLAPMPAVPEPGVLSLIAAASFTGFWLKRKLAVGRA